MAMIGGGTAGLIYLMLKGRSIAYQGYHTRNVQQMDLFHPVVKQRVNSAMAYFCGGLTLTGIMTGALRNSRIAYMNPWLLMFGSIGLAFGTLMTNYHTQPVLKHAVWLAFMGSMGVSMVPLINMVSMPIIFDAMMATGFTMGGLGLVAYNAPSE